MHQHDAAELKGSVELTPTAGVSLPKLHVVLRLCRAECKRGGLRKGEVWEVRVDASRKLRGATVAAGGHSKGFT